jgi:hypothetical protein
VRCLHHLQVQIDRPIGQSSTEFGKAQCVVSAVSVGSAIRTFVRHLRADGWRVSGTPRIRLIRPEKIDDPLLSLLVKSAHDGRIAYDTITEEVSCR